jgi:hypothetical protein
MPGSAFGGPVPKRSDQRRRVNKTEIEIETPPARGVDNPPSSDESWHPIAREWFDALGKSGQSVYFEASDWAQARLVAHAMNELLTADKISAHLFQGVLAGAAELLTTEGARRRLRIELAKADQGPSAAELAAAADLDSYRKRITG